MAAARVGQIGPQQSLVVAVVVEQLEGIVTGQPVVPEEGGQYRHQDHRRHGHADQGKATQPEGGQRHLFHPVGPVEHKVAEHRIEDGEEHQQVEEVEVAHRREEHGEDVQSGLVPVEHPLGPQQQ